MTDWVKMCMWVRVWVCVGESSVHLFVNVLTFTWQFSRWAECADASASGSVAVRGDDAAGYFRAGRGGAFSAEGGAKTVHCRQCLGTTLRVRKHKNTHRHVYAYTTIGKDIMIHKQAYTSELSDFRPSWIEDTAFHSGVKLLCKGDSTETTNHWPFLLYVTVKFSQMCLTGFQLLPCGMDCGTASPCPSLCPGWSCTWTVAYRRAPPGVGAWDRISTLQAWRCWEELHVLTSHPLP